MSGEVLILGVKGSGKTVFLSVLGHKFEGVGEFGLSLSPDRTTWNFAYECYHSMAPEDGSEQRFPKATDPNDDPVPLTWTVRAGTEPLFRMTTLECAGETMVKAFGSAGDEEAEARYSEEMTAAFDAIDAGNSDGIASKADTVTKLRAMAKRASVVCLFLNPRDFESQVAALPGQYRERLGRKLAQLREVGAGMEELRSAREASERALAIARGELKDRYGSMLDLLRTFLENEAYRGKRLVFVLTQTGGLEQAIEEAGGAWGYISANIRQLEAFDLGGRTEAITVSAVNAVVPVEDEDGTVRERPDGPIESTGLEDFLLTVGGACTPRLARLKAARRACLDAEQKAADAVVDGEPLEIRLAAAKGWLDAAAAWERAATRFVGELENVRMAVRQRTQAFAGADTIRAERRWLAENAMRERMAEDVASGTALDAGDLEGWLEVANGGVERKGLEPWTLDDLGLDGGWIAESLHARQERWDKLKQRFDAALERLAWREALDVLGETELDPYGVVRRSMERQAAEARRARAEMECRAALEGEDENAASRKLAELGAAEEEAGPSEVRPVLEEGLACLRSRLDVREVLGQARAALKGGETGRANEKETLAAAAAALPRAAALLDGGETEHGEENYRDLRQEWEACKIRLAKLARRRTIRSRTQWVLAVAAVIAVVAGWFAWRGLEDRTMARLCKEALDLAADGKGAQAEERLVRISDKPWLALKKSRYVTADTYAQVDAYRGEYGEALSAMKDARKAWQDERDAMVGRYGGEKRCRELGGDGWAKSEAAAQEAEKQTNPMVVLGADGRPDPGQDLAAVAKQYRAAESGFKTALAELKHAKAAAEKVVADYRRDRNALEKAREDREKRREEIAADAKEKKIPLGSLPEWKAVEAAELAARKAVAVPSGSQLPAEGNLADLAKSFRTALSSDDAAAEQALGELRKTVDARVALTSAITAAKRRGLDSWNGEKAEMAAKVFQTEAKRASSVQDLESKWKKVLAAGKIGPDSLKTPEQCKELADFLSSMLNNPSMGEKGRVFAEQRKTVCAAAEVYFAEKKRLQVLAEIENHLKGKRFIEAAKLAQANLSQSRTGDESVAAKALERRVLDEARKAAQDAIADSTKGNEELKTALVAAGYGSPELGKTISDAICMKINEMYPSIVSASHAVPLTFWRDANVLQELAKGQSGTQLANARSAMTNRVAKWNATWQKAAEYYANKANEDALAPQTLPAAWKECRTSEKAVGAILDNPMTDLKQREKAQGILDTLPALVCLHAGNASGGIRKTDYDGVHSDGVTLVEGRGKVAILVAENDLGDWTSVRVESGTGAKQKVQFPFPRHGTETKLVEF